MKAGWEVKPLEDVAFIQEGPGVRKYEYEENGFPMINVRCVQDGFIDMTSARAANTELAMGKWRHFQVDEGDILFTTSGTIGRCAIVQADNLPLLMNTSVVRFRSVDPSLDPVYLYLFLQSEGFQAPLKALSSGTAIQNVGPTHIKTLSIPLPPLEEQQRIVAVLDEAFEGLTRARTHAQTNLQNARELFESALDFEILPNGRDWHQKTLGEVCQFVGGSQPPKSDFLPEPAEGLVRLIQIRDYKSDSKAVFIPIKLARRFCTADDIMIGRYGPPIFQILRGIDGAYNVALMKAVPEKSLVSNDFLFYYLKNRSLLRYVITASSRAAGQDGVNKDALEAYPIGFPSLDEQPTIVAKLEAIQMFSCQIQTHYRTKLADIDALRQSLLQKAFAGELT